MGLFDFVKKGAQEMFIARPDEAKDLLVYKWPDRTIPMKAQITVGQDECALFYKDGKFVGRLDAGRHTLETSNIPFLSLLVDKFTGGNVLMAEVWYVTLREVGGMQFGGRIGFDGYSPSDLNVTARGQDVRLRYPEGVRSIVDADLSVTGTTRSPLVGGTVTVKSAVWARRLDTPGSIFDLASRRSGGGSSGPSLPGAEPPTSVPLRYDVRIVVPSTLRVDTNLVRLVATADLNLRGTYDRPVVFGHGDIERGQVIFEGQRYRITHGSIDFSNPLRIEPFFDVEAETNVRVPGQTYRVTVGATGTADQLRPIIASDPPLPTADVLALLFSDVARSRNTQQDLAPELRALQSPQQAQTDILAARATQAIAAPISSEVGKVVEQTFGVDTFQLTPSFVDPNSAQTSRLNPTARVTIGKRISDRVYFTFSRSLGATLNDQILLLEIEESDRLSWILSRNEDSGTYALEFRVRHTF